MGQYQNGHTKRERLRSPRSTGSSWSPRALLTSAVLKNALDYLYAEWNNKAAGFVSYGLAGGPGRRAPAAGCAELQIMTCASKSRCRC